MSYSLKQTRRFARAYKKLHDNVVADVNVAAEVIADNSAVGERKKGDLAEREHWDDYVDAYEEALSRTSTEAAPWYVIPADRKWFRNLAVSQVLVDTLESLDLRYPEPEEGIEDLEVL